MLTFTSMVVTDPVVRLMVALAVPALVDSPAATRVEPGALVTTSSPPTTERWAPSILKRSADIVPAISEPSITQF